MKKPNIVFFCTDQQRSDSLACCGNPVVQTPNLDRLARKGTRLTNHTTPCPMCSPSRATMFTGQYPRTHGLAVNGMALDERIPTLAQCLSESGYRTHGIGKHHLQPILAPEERCMPESVAFWNRPEADGWNGPYYGFQTVEFQIGEADTCFAGGHYARWIKEHHPEVIELVQPEAGLDDTPEDLKETWKCALPQELHYNSWIARQAVRFIEKVEDPFFLFVSTPDPHHPFTPPAPYCDLYDPADVVMPREVPGELQRMPAYISEPVDPVELGLMIQTRGISEASMRRAIAHTYGMVHMIDERVGWVVDALEKKGLMNDTIFVFTSDHGEYLGDHGLLHKGPPPYRNIREIPFIMHGPGIPSGLEIDAMTSHLDLMPTLLDFADARVPEGMAGQSLRPLLEGRQDQLRSTLFHEFHPRATADLYNHTVVHDNWRLTLYPDHPEWGELFDLAEDPNEHHNLFGGPAVATRTAALRRLLEDRFPPQPDVDNEQIAKW